MHRRPAASLIRPFGLLAAILLATFAGVGPAALANDTPGNNGTVKIHEGNTENDPGEVRNEPHVCTFHLHFYFADPVQAGTWEIQEWAPTGEKGTVVLTGTYDTAGDGEDRDPEDGVYTLPDGHYKLFWDGDLDTDKHDKMKVFWVDCDTESPNPAGSEAPIDSGSVPPSGSGSIPPSGSGSIPPSGSGSVPPSGSEAPIEGSGGPGGSVPGGGVLPLESTNPGGEVAGIDATPPPTDTESGLASSDQGWRVILLGLAALIAAAVFLVPNRLTAPAESRVSRRR
jgi:hypothetical protein